MGSPSPLKTLPSDQQKQIITWLKTSSQSDTLKLIQEQFGISTSPAALSRFFAWWHVVNPLDQLNEFILAFKEEEPDPALLRIKLDYLRRMAVTKLTLKAYHDGDVNLLKTVSDIDDHKRLTDLKVAQFAEDQQRYRHKLQQDAQDRQAAAELAAQAEKKADGEWEKFMDANPTPPPPPTVMPDPPAPAAPESTTPAAPSSSSSSSSSPPSSPSPSSSSSSSTPHSPKPAKPARHKAIDPRDIVPEYPCKIIGEL